MPSLEELQILIHDGVNAYCNEAHCYKFDPNNPIVRLHEPTFGSDEINAVIDVLLSTRVTMGPKVRKFEEDFTGAFGFPFGVMNNSGSSANLLGIAALANKEMEMGLRPGDEVIVPALAWSTTLWPLIQHGLIPVIVDIDPSTLNMDPNEVERAIGPRTRGIMPIHVYGNPCDMNALLEVVRRHELILIEDCCEALGAIYDGSPVGSFGRIGTFSFYFSHHMTTLEGGICVTNDTELSEMMRILRSHGWVRDVDDKQYYYDKYPEYDPKFLFVNLGYNLRATELQGAMGSVQLPKLDNYIKVRRENTIEWQKDLACWEEYFEFQNETLNARSSCFGFPMIRKSDAPFSLEELTTYLNKNAIETRPIICGNIAKQPAMKLYEHRVVGELQHSNHVMKNGFSFGNHQEIDYNARKYVTDTIAQFLFSKGLK